MMRWVLAIGLLLSAGVFSSPAISQTVLVECESYTAFQDLGGMPIATLSCSYASGGQAVDYVDVPGEWIQLSVTFPGDGYYSDSLCCAAYIGAVNTLRLTLSDEALKAEQTSDVEVVGSGIG